MQTAPSHVPQAGVDRRNEVTLHTSAPITSPPGPPVPSAATLRSLVALAALGLAAFVPTASARQLPKPVRRTFDGLPYGMPLAQKEQAFAQAKAMGAVRSASISRCLPSSGAYRAANVSETGPAWTR